MTRTPAPAARSRRQAMSRHAASARMPTIAALAAALAGAACSKHAAPPERPATPVVSVPVTVSDVTISRDYPAQAVSVRTVEIDARVEGWLLKQKYADGAMVDAGQLMYELDPAPYRIALEGAQATLAAAEANLFDATQKYERNKPLVSTGAISREEFDQLEAQWLSAKAGVLSAAAAVDNAKLNLSYCTITSPVRGQASKTRVYEGTLVKPQSNGSLTDVKQLDPVWIEFSPVSSDIPALRALQASGAATVPVRDPSGTWTGAGKVVFVNNAVESSTSTIVARIEVANPDLAIMPGQYLSVSLPQRVIKGALSVPQPAVVYQTAAAIVWTVTPEQTAKPTNIDVIGFGGAGLVIGSGLTADSRVIIEGQGRLAPGSKVAEAPKPAEPARTTTAPATRPPDAEAKPAASESKPAS
jgi:membrane fusion protein (multidrug efflux system)